MGKYDHNIKHGLKWNEFRKLCGDQPKPAEEQRKEALKVAQSLIKPAIEQPRRLTNVGDRRRIEYSVKNRKPLEGCTKRQSEILRMVVGLKYSGLTLKESFDITAEHFGIALSTVENVYYKHPDGVELATEEHLKICLKDLHTNLWIINTMLSDRGPRAVQVLGDVLDDEDATPNVKKEAAKAILQMVGVNNSAGPESPADRAVKEGIQLIKKMKEDSEKEKESYIFAADVDTSEADVSEN